MVLLRRIANLFSRGRIEAEIEAELLAHLEMRIADNMAAGMSKQEARCDALRRFGNPVVIKERTTGIDAALNLAIWWFDVQYAWRRWRKSPVFAATTVLTLALGIGTSTAIFSVTNVMLLRLMPVANPQNLYYLHVPGELPKGSIGPAYAGASFSLPVFEALRKQQDAFSDVMAFALVGDTPVRFGADDPEEVTVDMVSGNFFSGLGVPAALGRVFAMADENQNAPVVVLSYACWTRRFSRKPDLLGRTLSIRGIPFSIVGIAKEGFWGTHPGLRTDLWIPLQRGTEIAGTALDRTIYKSPNYWSLVLLARLAPGVSFEQAAAKVDPAYQAAAYAGLSMPDRAPRIQLTAFPAHGTRGLWEDPHDGPITFMMMLVMLVLVIACCNVAMLLVTRNAARQRDFSVRMALGAGRGALLRQLFAESGLLVLAGALLGWLIAVGVTRIYATWSRLEVDFAPDRTVLLFTGTVSVLAALIFALAPMRSATNVPIAGTLRTPVSTIGRTRRGGNLVMAVQVALCFTLLVASGLQIRTLLNDAHAEYGIRTEGLLVFGISPPEPSTSEARFRFYRELLDRLRSLPKVESASLVENRLGGSGYLTWRKLGLSAYTQQVYANCVGPGFFHVIGVPLVAGREIEETDTDTSAPVVIVNETFVREFLPNTNPLGQTIHNLHLATIVGVVGDSKFVRADEPPSPAEYYAYTQLEKIAPVSMQVEIHTAGDPMAVLPAAKQAVHRMDPDLLLEEPTTQSAAFGRTYWRQRANARRAVFLSSVAVLLIGIGLYGTLSYRISRRSAEIGLRLAVGAQRWQLLTQVLREALQITGVGVLAGIPMSLMTGYLMRSMLYQVKPYDFLSTFAALVCILAITLASSLVPACRAASLDPAQTLRSE